MHDYSRRLRDAVKRARENQELTQNELAEKIAVAPRTILNIENYKGNPKPEILVSVIRALKIDPHEIFYPEVAQRTQKQQQLQLQISDCTDDEMDVLISACRTILESIRTTKN